jgi:glutamate 5-kinase
VLAAWLFVRVTAIISTILYSLYCLLETPKQVILVTSGAVNSGRFQLRKAAIMGASFHQQLSRTGANEETSSVYSSACASAGQLGSIYATLFAHCDVSVSQYLVTSYDFTDDARKQHLSDSIDLILAHGMVPILNENDAVRARKKKRERVRASLKSTAKGA